MKFSHLSAFVLVSAVLGTELHPNVASNKCLDVVGNVHKNGTQVDIFDCNGTPAQQWELNLSETQVRLANTNFCLDAGDSPANNTPMKIWTCIPGIPAQTWFFTTDERIALENQGFCLDLTNGDTTNGNVVQIFKCTDGNTNQIWMTT